MAKKRIALVTAWFPPNNGVAVNRMNAFAHYLGEDYEVEVFTLGSKAISEKTVFGQVHYQPTKAIWDKIQHRTTDGKLLHTWKTGVKFILGRMGVSMYGSWKKNAVAQLKRRHAETPFSVIISSYAPTEAHDVAFALVNKHPELRWITDMRDEMGSNPFLPATEKERLRKKELEYLPRITALTTISAPILEDFRKVMPGLQDYVEVRNGFDHDVAPKHNFNPRFTVAYAGTFYGKRKPDHLFEAVVRLIEEGKVQKEDLLFRFIGTNHNFAIPAVLSDRVEFVHKIPYTEAIEMMAEADCNLLVNPPLGTKGQFSGKIFDYISVEKPILALVDMEDVAAELIHAHRAGIAVEFDDVAGTADAFLELYGYWQRKEHYPVDTSKTQELHRRFQVDKMKTLIEKITQA